jgi:hypothetical protein
MLLKDHIVLASMVSFDLYWPHVRFVSPDKPSSPVTTLLNRPSLLWGGLLEGEWDNLGWRLGRTIAGGGGQDFILRVGAQIWLSKDFAHGCHMWDLRGHAYNVLVRFFPCKVYIDWNHRNTLRYEWPLVRYCHLVVYLVVLMAWIRWWLWLWCILYLV